MKLLFDLYATQPNSTGKRHGGGKYGEVILFRMIERGMKFSCAYDSTIWLNPVVKDICEKNKIDLLDISQMKWEEIVEHNDIDLIYSCLPYHLINVNNCKIIATIHGLRGVELPFDIFSQIHYMNYSKYFSIIKSIWHDFRGDSKYETWRWYYRMISKTNMQFVTVSNHSKYSMLSQYPDLDESSIRVFYSPSTSSFKPAEKDRHESKYFLMVSANRWDKNNLRGVIALDRLFSSGMLDGYKVILTGYEKASISKFKSLFLGDCEMGKYSIKNKNKFIFKGYVTDNELNSLYANAYALIYPSLNEGFGYPPLEAMRYGVPVLASAIASIPEVLGNAAIYFNAFSIEEIMNRIVQISNPDVYNKYISLSKERYSVITRKQNEDLDALIDYIILNI